MGPVFKTISPVLSAPTVCMVGLPLGLSVLREHEASLCPIGISFDALIPRKLLRSMSADDHPGYRRLFQRAFRDDVVEACLPEIEGIVGSGLSQLADESVRSAPRGLAPRSYLESLVLTAFLQLFFGLTPDSVRAEAAATQLLHIGQDVGGRIGGRRYRKVALAADGLASIIREQGALLCDGQQSGTEPPRSFLEALLRERPDALDDPTITFNLVFLARTAATDVTGLLHWILKMLGDNQEWIGALRASTDRTDLAQRVVMETLRLEQSELLFRTVREEINVGGYVVPAGWHLRVCVRESHQDQSVFDRPERFDPDRFQRRYNRQQYSPLVRRGTPASGRGRSTRSQALSSSKSRPAMTSSSPPMATSSSTNTGDRAAATGSFSGPVLRSRRSCSHRRLGLSEAGRRAQCLLWRAGVGFEPVRVAPSAVFKSARSVPNPDEFGPPPYRSILLVPADYGGLGTNLVQV